jgi:predicted RNase H-like HicB family nuclease
MELTAFIKKGEEQFVAICPEVDVASQGYTVEEALRNLKEAVELYVEEMGLPAGCKEQEAIIARFTLEENAKAA